MLTAFKHILIMLLLIGASSTLATENLASDKPPLRTALVLSGGGALGAAHIGVLEILEREHIPIDCIVGTSMGALVAGAYASGLSPADMRKKLEAENWTDIFLDGADNSQRNYRQTHVTRRYLSGTQMGLTKKGLQLQSGVIAGAKIKLFFNQLVGADLGEKEIQQLPIPIAIIATDLGSGEKHIFRDGSLTQAMRASMSVPGLMAPVEFNGRKLVDGALVENLPVDTARELCNPDRIIAINVSKKLKSADEINSLLSVTEQMIDILTQQNIQRSIALLKPQDIYIYPSLEKFATTDFSRHKEIADIGHIAAEEHLAQLKTLSTSPEKYAKWQKTKQDERNKKIVIDEIKITPLKLVNPNFVARQIHQKENTTFDRAQLEQDLIRTYADGYFTSVDYKINNEHQKNILEITAKEKSGSKDYVTFGYALESEYQQGSRLNLLTAYRNTWVNHYGGEFFAAADLGSNSTLKIDFYQPLDSNYQFFVEPIYSRSSELIGIFSNDKKIAEYTLNTAYSEISLGLNTGTLGQATVGWREYHKKGEANVKITNFPNIDEHYGGVLSSFAIDKRNRLYFPSNGWYTDLRFFDSRNQDYQKLTADIGFASSFNNLVIAGRSAYTSSTDGELPIYDAATLGGFLNMSGYASNQILGDETFYLQLRSEQIIGRMPLGLSGDLRIGFGIEATRVGKMYTLPDSNTWLDSAVIYLGGETPIGPVYIGYGFTLSGDYNLYFRVGSF